MKITLSQEKLASALSYVSRAVSTKPNIPVLSNVLLEISKDKLKLSATNLDMGINLWIAGMMDTEGKVTVSGKFLTDFVSATGAGKVTLSLDEESLNVKTDDSQASFNTIPASEFPILPKAGGEPFITLETSTLLKALEKVVFATSTDFATSKVQYTGVLFEITEEEPEILTLVGLDGFRLSKKTIKLESKKSEPIQLIIPSRPLQEMVKILQSESPEVVQVYLSESKTQILFKFDEVEISVRLLEGPYPDYERVVPTEHAFSFDVDKDEFVKALKVVNTFARSIQGARVDFDLDLEKGTLLLRSKVPDLGINETKVKVEKATGSSDLKDAYSLNFLIDMAGHLEGDIVHFETNAPLAAAVFTEPDDEDFIHLVMPLQRTD